MNSSSLGSIAHRAAKIVATVISVLAFSVSVLVPAITHAQTTSTPEVVYDAIPATLPPNVVSLGYEATQTSEFGDYIHLGGTNRVLNTVTLTMSDWALQSSPANVAYCTANPASCTSSGFTYPITLNVYSNHLGANGVPDTLLATKTEDVTIPWRPEADPTDCPSEPSAYKGSDGSCYNGIAFNASFDMSGLNVTVPNDIILTAAYNTEDYGTSPTHVDGPYDSLNVGVNDNQAVTVGTDDNTNDVFWNTQTASDYADNGSAGVSILREDTNWSPNGTVNLEITANPPATDVYVNANAAPGGNGTQSAPFQTIAAGVAAVPAGGTVHVAAGSYDEQVVINKSITLDGAQAGVSASSPYAAPRTHGDATTESVLTGSSYSPASFKVTAPNVTIDGFDFGPTTDAASTGPVGVDLGNSSGATVTNSIFEHNQRGISLSGASNVTITNDLISYNNSDSAANANAGIWGDTVNGININNSELDGASNTAINLATGSSNITINADVFKNDGNSAVIWGDTNATFSNNYVRGLNGSGFFVSGTAGMTISDNDITAGPTFNGISISTASGQPSSAVVITGNTINGFGNGINIADASAVSDVVEVHGNDLSDNSNTAINAPTSSSTIVDATGNYFGANGPNVTGDTSTVGAVDTGTNDYCTTANCSTTTTNSIPGTPTNITAMFQYDSSNLPNNSVINYTAKPGNNNLELNWTAPANSTVTSYQILDTYPDGTTSIGYQGPNTNAWLLPNGFGAHGDGVYTYQVVAVNTVGDSQPSATFTITYGGTSTLAAPTNLAPANGSVTNNPAFDNTWSPVSGAVSYQYQTSNSEVNSTTLGPVIYNDDSTTATNYDIEPTIVTRANNDGTPAGNYYWQVRAVDANGNPGAWSAVNEVTYTPATSSVNPVTPVQLAAPTDLTPTDASTTTDTNFSQTWSTVPGAAKYDYQVTTSYDGTPADFTSMGEDFSDGSNYSVTASTVTRYNSDAPLQTYYWRVRAIDASGNDGAWSPVYEVTVAAPVVTPITPVNPAASSTPSAPTGTFPSDASTLTSSALTQVSWTPVTVATDTMSYLYEVSNSNATNNDGSFSTPIDIGTNGSVTTPYVLTSGTPDATYYWHVQAIDSTSGLTSPWSTTESFTVSETATSTATSTSAGSGNSTPATVQSATYTIQENSAATPVTLQITTAGMSGDINYAITTQPEHGTLSPITNGVVEYTPATGYYGSDSFAYNAQGGTPGTVSFMIAQVTPTYSTPVAVNGTATSTLDAPVTITLAATNSDGNPITYATTSSPTNGILSAISGDTVTYTPDTGYNGTDSFNFTGSNEGNATSTPATVTINVTAPTFTGSTFSSNVAVGGGVSGSSIAHSFAASSAASSGSTGGSVDGGQVLGASTYNFTKNLGLGSVGEDVTQLQLVLISDGYMSTSTGYFGSITKAAVKKYQAANNISPISGYVGPLTRAVLNEGTTPTVAQEAASMSASTTASTATTTVTATSTSTMTGTSTPASTSTATSSPVSIAATSLVNKLAAEIAALEAELSATTTASTTTATSTPSN